MNFLSILLVCLFCLAWLIVIAASQLAKAAELIDETNETKANQ